jgi:hypothetical protein
MAAEREAAALPGGGQGERALVEPASPMVTPPRRFPILSWTGKVR